MFRTRSSKSLLLLTVVFFLLACQIPGLATPTPAPAATEAPVATEAPAIVVEPTDAIVAVHSEKFAQYSPNGKHITKIVTENGGDTWNLVLDGKIRDEKVEEIGPVVWSPESDAFVLAGPDGLCYYVGKNVGTNPQFCYEEFPMASAVSYVIGYHGEKVWFVYKGDIYSVTPDLKSEPVKFTTEEKVAFIDLDVTKNGYYLAATTDQGELMVFEAGGKFIRTYDCANAAWALDGKMACVTLNNTDASILLIDITDPGKEVSINVKGLRPQNLLFSPNGSKLAFYDAGGVFWVRLIDYEIFYASDPNGLGFNHSWRPNTSYIVFDECVEQVCTTKEVVPSKKNVWKHK